VGIVTCLCGVRIEGDGTDALVTAFRRHTSAQHPRIKVSDERRKDVEDAIRRTGGWDGRREQLTGPIVVRPLTPSLKQECLSYFDGPAFADNPVWAPCYCLSYHLNLAPEDFDNRGAAENRADRGRQIERGEASGVMAFAGDRVVGWCNASPRTSLPLLDRTRGFECDDPDRTGAIACYVIAPQFRGQGIARRLLDGATDMLRARGLRWLEAYPPRHALTDASSYHGKLSMYLDAGFEQVRETERYVVVRKAL
jgi:ribosomal protein S18 acetylase RimI-like enzyme